ncbi:hypothetical protein ZOSMA_4G00520 [Zostera marina]|uniref:Vacuolar protein sorting-associated protein 62 n=1 Tax=Zostera marina TaxID=29655 RepID=A0A0K9P0L2_ZOSMR|nr:hypothetical protein ZOSMA_4G00520 [Zostera marina]
MNPDRSFEKITIPNSTMERRTNRLPFPLSPWPPGDGFGTGMIDLGGLELTQVSTFTEICSIQGGVTFYNPSSIPTGFSMLGSYAHTNVAALSGWVLVGRDINSMGSLVQPLDYVLIWTSKNGGHFWQPIAPEGYGIVGIVVTSTADKPSTSAVRCVRTDFMDDSEKVDEPSSVLSVDGVEIYRVRPSRRGVESPCVDVGTFACSTAVPIPTHHSPIRCLKNKHFTRYSSMPTLRQIDAVLKEYSPLIYFHPNEKYLCSSVEFLFSSGAQLFHLENGSTSPATQITTTGSNLPQGRNNSDGSYWISLPTDVNRRKKVIGGDLSSSDVYVHVKPMFGGTFTDLVFWMFYPFNGPATAKLLFLKNIPLGKIGQHEGDWEHMTLRVSNFNGELGRVFFSQHSGGSWIDLPFLEFADGTNKVVGYSALNGHAFYPTPGLVMQGTNAVGIRNDTAKGKSIDTGAIYKIISADYMDGIVTEPTWLNYYGKWGSKVTYRFTKQLRKIIRLMPRRLRRRLKRLIQSIPSELLGEEGPTGPKVKNNWTGPDF